MTHSGRLCAVTLLAANVSAAGEPAQKNKQAPAVKSAQSVQLGNVSGSAQVMIQQTLSQTINQIRKDDPRLADAVLRLTQLLGSKEAESRSLRDENSKLQQPLALAQAAQRLGQEARAPNAPPDVAEARAQPAGAVIHIFSRATA